MLGAARARLRMKRQGHLFSIVVLVCVMPARAIAQDDARAEPSPAQSAREELIHAFQNESKLGAHLLYAQSYKVHHRRVEFEGSIFGQIQDIEADGCELKIRSTVIDRYSGTVGEGPVGQTQNEYKSLLRLKLTMKLAAALEVVVARPVRQLSVDSHALCSENSQCFLTWIRLRSDSRSIHLTEFTNDIVDYDGYVKDFDGQVAQFWLPVSTREAGAELIAKMRTYAQSCAW
jgi:hypothetical protein